MTLAEVRDRVRRLLGVVPAVDTLMAGAAAGDNVSWQPHPSNALLNQCIEKACACVSVEAKVTDDGAPLLVDVDAQTEDGPYEVKLGELEGYRAGALNTVKSCWWHTTDGGDYFLTPTTFYSRERSVLRDWARPPGMPYWYAVEDYRLWLIPAPDTAGQVRIRAGFGMIAPTQDAQDFRGLPNDYMQYLIDIAALEVAMAMPGDTEMQQRIQILSAKRQLAIEMIARWYGSDKQEAAQAQITARTTRRTY